MGFSLTGIDHIQFAAPKGCETAARDFWSGKIGLKEIDKPASLQSRGGCWFQIGNQEIHVGVEDEFTPAKKAHPAFVVSNIEEFREHLESVGVQTRNDKPINGRSRFFVDDPFGNRVEFLEYKA